MTYRNRYILRITIFLTALLAAGSGMAQGVVVHGNVYGGGNLADVKTNTEVNICAKKQTSGETVTYVAVSAGNGVTIEGNVYGGGKGVAKLEPGAIGAGDAFECKKAMVGIDGDGVGADNKPKPGGTTVRIFNGTVGTLEGTEEAQTLKEGTGNVYGGGQVGRVERNTVVTIGAQGDDNSVPNILGNVFGAGRGEKTHGYSALVRGNSDVTIQGSATVGKSIYGGGQIATVGKYTVVDGLPTTTTSGGICTVTIRDNATITENVFGAGKGTLPYEGCGTGDIPQHMNGAKHLVDGVWDGTWDDVLVEYPEYDPEDYDQNKPEYANYIKFIKSLALVSDTEVTIDGESKVNGSVYGGSESGFVQQNTQVKILGTCVIGTTTTNANIFGGGLGSDDFAEAGIVRGNTEVYVNGGTTNGTVYGGGSLGNVKGTTEVNIYANKVNDEYVVVAKEDDDVTITGNVYGGGKGHEDTFTCEKAMVGVDGDGIEHPDGGTTVRIFNGKVNGSVYGGGQVGRVEKNTVVTIGSGDGGDDTSKPYIGGDVFGAGAGVKTHGFSALVRGNSTVTVEGDAQIGESVYGGGQIATVGRYIVINSLPTKPAGGGLCTVHIQGYAIIGQDSEGDVFGAGKGIMPFEGVSSGNPWSMQSGNTIKTYSQAEKDLYFSFIQTLGLAGDTEVTIGANASVKGSVYGGSESGFVQRNAQVTIQGSCEIGTTVGTGDDATDQDGYIYGGGRGDDSVEGYAHAGKVKGNTTVNINGGIMHGSVYGGGEKGYTVGRANVNMAGGTVYHDVYGGGALADTNVGNGDNVNGYVEVLGLTAGSSSVVGYYENTYVDTGDNTAVANKTYYYGNNHAQVTVLTVGSSLEDLETDLYEESGTQTTDETALANKVYYTQSSVPFIITVGTNTTIGGTKLSEWSESDYVASDGTAVTGKKYYTITHPTTVNLTGGTIKGDAYGGGLGRLGEAVEGVHYTSEEATAYNTEHELSEGDAGYKTTADWKTQPVAAADGTGSVKATVYGDINVNLGSASGSTATAFYLTNYDGDHAGVVKSGRVFGCNNLNGSPQGNVTVDVFKTVEGNSERTDEDAYKKKVGETGYVAPTYEVAAVYGGGNLADFTATGKKASVIIETCYVSIESVYGGGNAADVPETDVLVKGAYEIGEVFGGGNGEDSYTTDGGAHWTPNPGADVNGNATTLLKGGYIHEAYGGSNTKGTISGDVSINKSSGGVCTLQVDDLYGAGKNADVEGDLIVVLGCSETRTENVYGCSMNANVKGNVELTITSGEYGKVFGGNNQSGSIFGHIIVNIEEVGCSPIIIDELYGCGNDAAYSVYGYYRAKQYSESNKLFLDAGKTIPIYTDNSNNLYKDEARTIPLYKDNDDFLYIDQEKTKPLYMPRTSADDQNTAVTFEGKPHTNPSYADPEVNIISCTRIGRVFGGGYGENATVYGNPKVNINMLKGAFAGQTYGSVTYEDELGKVGDGYTDSSNTEIEGGVFGGGNQAPVYGNTNVNIGTETDVYVVKTNITTGTTSVNGYYTRNDAGAYTLISDNDATAEEGVYYYEKKTVLGANITGSVYGGGNLADVGHYTEEADAQVANRTNNRVDQAGNTNVNIGAKLNASGAWESVTEGSEGVIITGNVYGGGKGSDESFYCDKAMVLGNLGLSQGGGTNVRIGNGTVKYTADANGNTLTGNVYGGGEIARVENNTAVTIGFGTGVAGTPTTNKPVIEGCVFGAGAGLRTHGYSALVRGHSSVTIEGNAKIGQCVYGGGELATVGRYYVNPTTNVAEYNISGGECTVTIGGYAEIGPDDMVMKKATGGPDDYGHVFGAGKGVLPYAGYDDSTAPWSKIPNGQTTYKKYNELGADKELEAAYVKYIKTLALATKTNVTIKYYAFVKGSVYGGSENGFVQEDTYVTIQDYCQIGNGYVQMKDDGTYLTTGMRGVNRRYTDAEWTAGHLITTNDASDFQTLVSENCPASLPECASWPFGEVVGTGQNAKTVYAPYDPFASTVSGNEEKYEQDTGRTTGRSTEGGRRKGSDGHTFYGNVFGGGSGYYPYRPGRWFEDAGAVYGDTYVTITGGHILTSVYGGNEMTDVGKYDDNDRLNLTSGGSCYVTMIGGTLGVPRTLKQIGKHPVTCYLFGAGKGDQRVFFNKSTNVGDVYVHISDDARIYGSVFGGGEDGHVMKNVTMNIGGNTLPDVYSSNDHPVLTALNLTANGTTHDGAYPYIGTWGTSYVEGNVFGAGRGFGGDAYTAGNVAGTVTMNILGGTMLGSIYGGGRLGSVGYGLFDASVTANYGKMQDDYTREKYDGTLENNVSGFKRGYVYMTIGKADGTGPTIGNTNEYIIPNTDSSTGNTPSTITESDFKKWSADDWTAWKNHNRVPNTEYDTTTGRLIHTKGGNVFAGGMGRLTQLDGSTPITTVDWWKLGCVKSTTLTIRGGTIKSNVYGGGELGQVVGYHTTKNAANQNINAGTEITIQGSSTTIGKEIDDGNTVQYTFGSVFGGGYGSLGEEAINGKYPKFEAGLVEKDTKIDMQNGAVKASIYGGGEMASVNGSTDVAVSNGTIGIAPSGSGNNIRYFGGAKMGNVYGGGSGHGNTVRSGRILKNTNVTISGGTVYHNVYGGGAYGTVGDFDYDTGNDGKVTGVKGLATTGTGTGVATVTITGGIIGSDGRENGMVFGSSRGDINQPRERDDHTAWVYNANVTIGTAATPASGTPDTEGYVAATPASGPDIKGSVYGSGENGHTFNNTVVTVNGGTIGIASGSPITTDDNGTPNVTSDDTILYGAAYPYRGNVYGGGCGTDKYYSDHTQENHDGNGQLFNPLAGIVYGTTTININGGTVVHNVYGAGAMGSVGKATTTEGVTTITGGTTTINVSGGTIGVDGTNGDGNVFGAARGDEGATITEAALVRKSTNVSITGGTIEGNVYGGGELGCVGTFTVSDDMRTFTWQDTDGTINTAANSAGKNTGVCNVTVDGSSAVINGHVYGAGKGKESTFWCEKGIAYSTNVNISNGTVNRNVYGGGEVGRVETDSKVKIGSGVGTEGGASVPTITGSVFGGGAGVETHGYSALVRGNTYVTVEGNARVGHSVYGGGEIASVGKYGLDDQKMPSILQGGGYCYVTVKGHATIADDVFGAGEGVTPHFDMTNTDPSERSRRMTVYTNATDFPADKEYPKTGYTWGRYETGSQFVWDYLQSESAYSTYLETLALATHPEVTIDGNATVSGSVFGGGELGLTKGSVIVNIQGGTIAEDVYGGGSLAHSNTTSTVDLGNGVTEVHPTTTVNLKGGTINRDVYGGGLGRLAKDAVGAEGQTGYIPAVTAVEAKVYGNVLVKLNGPEEVTQTTGEGNDASTTTTTTYGNCVVKGTIFGCNNLNGSPQKDVTVHVWKTVGWTEEKEVTDDLGTHTETVSHMRSANKDNTTYELTAVYGGGNLAAYYPDDATARETAKANVIIDGCDMTSIKTVYGGGNAASVPATDVVVNGTYEIGDVFGGGNGADDYQLDGKWYDNPGANVGYRSYAYFVKKGETGYIAATHGSGTSVDPYKAIEYTSSNGSDQDASTKDKRLANYAYGDGKAHATIYGGTVHSVYGGSNTKGNVRVESRTTLEDREQCPYNVGDAFGGGNNADQDGDAILEVGCISGLEIAYGGASNADVNGDVKLNLTNGTYGKVFGGNNQGGAIRGSIIVNIEETGCNPIIIGELYCGGNEAAYSVYGYNNDGTVKETGSNPVPDPVLNVKSFTSIGKIFGGGYGEDAKMVGNPEVNINVVKGKYSNRVIAEGEKVYGFDIPSHEAGTIGAIGSVFGGGNAAEVIGTPHVNIGTKVGEVMPLVSISIEDSEGKAPSENGWTPSYQLVTVEGVDIRDNVYGGGNNAQVTGDTEVIIGKSDDVKTYSFTSYSALTGGNAWSSGLAQTTGKYVTLSGNSKLAEVEILTNGKYDKFVGQKFYVDPNAETNGSNRTELKKANGASSDPQLFVSIKPFVYKTYNFTSYSASSGGTQYSTGTAAPTGNFKTFNSQDYMQIQVLTNPGEASWIGRTFYVPANANTNGTERTQLRKATGDPEDVWVSISEINL